MKKKILSIILLCCLSLSLVACGGDKTNKETINKNSVESNSEIETNVEIGINTEETKIENETITETKKISCLKCGWFTETFDSDFCHGCGNRDLQIEINGEIVTEGSADNTPLYSKSYGLDFPAGMTGFTDKYVYTKDPNWSTNENHYVDVNGNEIDFTWEGPTVLGESAGQNGITLNLLGGNYDMRVWYSGDMKVEEIALCLKYSKEEWTAATAKSCTLPENGFYEIERVSNAVIVTYEVVENSYGRKGYVRYLCDADVGYAFGVMYTEDASVYDEERVMKVIESVDYWLNCPYNPENQ